MHYLYQKSTFNKTNITGQFPTYRVGYIPQIPLSPSVSDAFKPDLRHIIAHILRPF